MNLRLLKEGFDKFLIKENSSVKVKLVNYLKRKFKNLEDTSSSEFLFDVETAIYWFATDYHGRQNSPLYKILSSSMYKPGRGIKSVHDESDVVVDMYNMLVKISKKIEK